MKHENNKRNGNGISGESYQSDRTRRTRKCYYERDGGAGAKGHGEGELGPRNIKTPKEERAVAGRRGMRDCIRQEGTGEGKARVKHRARCNQHESAMGKDEGNTWDGESRWEKAKGKANCLGDASWLR
jgi:hypothetical protein